MHEVTVTPSIAHIFLILSACSFTKICNWREVDNDRAACIKPSAKILKRISCMLFLPKLYIHISDHVISYVVTDIQILNISVLAQLLKQILIEILKVVLDLAGVEILGLGVDAGSEHVGALVHVGEEKGGADGGLRVEARAAVAMPARADLEVERAVHSVLLRTEYGRQVLRHGRLTGRLIDGCRFQF